MTSPGLTHQRSGEIETIHARDSDDGPGRTSIDMDPAGSSTALSQGSSAVHRSAPLQKRKDVQSEDEDRPKLAPIYNGAVKALPDEQPVWPIPKTFSFGDDRVSLSPDFKIRLQPFVSSSSESKSSTAAYPVLEKAIARCLDRIQSKRNTTTHNDITGSTAALAGVEILSELVILVDDALAPLEFGMAESYTLNITTAKSKKESTSYQVALNMEDGMPQVASARVKRAVPSDGSASESKTLTAILKASTQWGVIHGLETFSQLLQAISSESATEQPVNNRLDIPNAPWSIHDEPRYSHRGLLLDTSRHYIPVKDIIRTLDAMSVVKLNVFHWHVLDQQSYPLVSKAHPDLTAKGAERPGYVYTQQDVASIIQFAEERGIRVIPEFDAPGHTASWGRAYPNITVCLDMQPHNKYAAQPPAGQLDPLEPFTYTVLNDLVKEWATQFPDKHVHIGGDEINAECWKTSERLRDYMQNPGHRSGYEKPLLQIQDISGEMIRRASSGSQSGLDKLLELYLDKVFGMYLAQGKVPLVWEEIALEHNVRLPSTAVVQVWKNSRNAKRVIEQGRPVILSGGDYWYLDCGSGSWLIGSQGESWCKFSSWQRMYSYQLTDQLNLEQQKMVYGGEVCMWSEQTDSSNLDSNLWPRTAAAAEVLWSGDQDAQGETRPLLQAAKRLEAVRERLTQMGVRAAPVFPSWCAKHPETCLA
ncbi:hypothetical protein BGZ72_010056 [Mortierella alpina]|nr:hypothetical protein BGZ72_010008 [Mortierella alpina]KAF9962166.1 hypothetical protein BGZ72_010056 [Mortierella alpina]